MTPKNNIDFLTFNDGVAAVYETDENDAVIVDSVKKYRYGEEKIGVTRFYSAKQHDIDLQKVIHVHLAQNLRTDMAVIIDDTCYKVEQIQHSKLTNPPSTVLSLSQRGLFEGAFENEF